MTYLTGTVQNVSPGPVLYASMQPVLTTAGFTFVETVVIASRTHQVWKSSAASNSQNRDWYLDIGYGTSGSDYFTLQCFEFYDPATHLGYRGLYSASSTIIDPTTYSRYGSTGYALETNWLGNSALFYNYALYLTNTSNSYFFSATTNRIIMMFTGDLYAVFYVGLYNPDPIYAAKAGAALYPLIGMRLVPGSGAGSSAASTSVTAALTRVPPASALSSTGWGVHVYVQVGSGGVVALPTGSTEMYSYVTSPIRIASGGGLPSTVFGSPYDLTSIASTTSIGNTVTCDGSTWVLSQATSNYSAMFRTV